MAVVILRWKLVVAIITTDKKQKPAFKIKVSWGAEIQAVNKKRALTANEDKVIAKSPGFRPSQKEV